MEELLLLYLSTTLGLTKEKAADLVFKTNPEDETKKVLKENALKLITDADKSRVAQIKTSAAEDVDTTEIFNDAFAKAEKKVKGKVEKQLAQAFQIEDASKLKLSEIVEKIQASKAGDGSGLDEDKVKLHPLYLALEKSKTEEVAALEAAKAKELEDLKAGFVQGQLRKSATDTVKDLFKGLKPVLSSDSTKAANQIDDFASKFNVYDYQEQEDKSFIVLKDGKRLEDEHGNPVTLNALVQKEASTLYDFAVQDGKGAPGNGGGGAPAAAATTVPKNDEEYSLAILSAGSAEERDAIEAAYAAK